ncbi:peptidoglycan D,D-transpeptidase MrdA [Rubritalea halochordaticola]|uniref:beta-lactamase n=1 Tax=Rubritalea halochordaticola TaxID=714537 RepID=A0ABP9V5G7_9BACT
MSVLTCSLLAVGMAGYAQQTALVAANTPMPPEDKAPEVAAPTKRSADQADVFTRPDARTMTLSIPALRGQIVDRYGNPLAQNKVVWYPALQYQQFENADREFVVRWGRERINKANQIFGINWKVSDDELWEHYRHRRWLAMPYTHVVTAEQKKLFEPKLIDGLILHPLYQRYYPQGETAAHIIGYVGSKGKLEKGPINYGDPIFEYTEGRSGLELLFDEQLTGTPGLRQLQYDSNGTEVLRELKRAPKQGNTVVTTLDLAWQKRAEEVLDKHARKGALVILDIRSGEVVAMASKPSYDLNTFVPFISQKEYDALREDPDAPLFGRAFQAAYPPASTFKPIVAMAALHHDVLDGSTMINCPAYIELGRHKMWNWSKKPEGQMNIVRGMMRSNNPFFIQIGIATRPGNLTSMARRLGYGSKSGLPLVGEEKGQLLTNDYTLKHYKRRVTDGDTANMSIGQGAILATPLQVAQGMAAIANGTSLPQLQLVRQIQDAKGRVETANKPHERNPLGVQPYKVSLVQEGMMAVVNSPEGTGKAAWLDYTVVCGKTGTAQWGPESKEQKLGWFAGFFPLEKPKYAFAMVYEGMPGEKVSGGSKAAPMVKAFFKPIKDDVVFRINPPARAMVVTEEEIIPPQAQVVEGDGIIEDGPAKAIPVDEDNLDLPPPPKAVPVEEDDVPSLQELPPGGLPDTPPNARRDGIVPSQPLQPLNPQDPLQDPNAQQGQNGGQQGQQSGPPKAVPVEE